MQYKNQKNILYLSLIAEEPLRGYAAKNNLMLQISELYDKMYNGDFL